MTKSQGFRTQVHILNQPLVYPHLIRIPRLASFTTGRLPRRVLESLRRHTHGAFHPQIFGFGAVDQLLADLLQRLYFARGQGDPDLVDFLWRTRSCLARLFIVIDFTASRELRHPFRDDLRDLRQSPSPAFDKTCFLTRWAWKTDYRCPAAPSHVSAILPIV